MQITFKFCFEMSSSPWPLYSFVIQKRQWVLFFFRRVLTRLRARIIRLERLYIAHLDQNTFVTSLSTYLNQLSSVPTAAGA